MTKNQLIKTTCSSLSAALRGDNQVLALRELSTLSIQKIINAQDTYEELNFRLESLRKSYVMFKREKIKDRVKHMAEIKKMAGEVKLQVAEIPHYATLFELRKNDEQTTLNTITFMVIDIALYFQTGQVMSKDMAQEVSLRILLKFGGLTLEDVALCLHKVKNGEYGNNYNKVDGGSLMQWLNRYEAERQEIGMEMTRRIHNQGKSGVWKEGHEYRLIEPKRLKELV